MEENKGAGNSLGRSCWGKVKRTETGAKATAELRRKGRRGGINPVHANLDAYKCDYCDGWHIGHTMESPPQPINC